MVRIFKFREIMNNNNRISTYNRKLRVGQLNTWLNVILNECCYTTYRCTDNDQVSEFSEHIFAKCRMQVEFPICHQIFFLGNEKNQESLFLFLEVWGNEEFAFFIPRGVRNKPFLLGVSQNFQMLLIHVKFPIQLSYYKLKVFSDHLRLKQNNNFLNQFFYTIPIR